MEIVVRTNIVKIFKTMKFGCESVHKAMQIQQFSNEIHSKLKNVTKY